MKSVISFIFLIIAAMLISPMPVKKEEIVIGIKKTRLYIKQTNKKRPVVHSKNASKGENGYKQKYRGQGR